MSLDDLIRQSVSCTLCGTKGFGNCDCWKQCHCGWHYEREGGRCGNPIHLKGKRKPSETPRRVIASGKVKL